MPDSDEPLLGSPPAVVLAARFLLPCDHRRYPDDPNWRFAGRWLALCGLVIGLVYGWLPDMVLPCYAAIERLDYSLVEAAQDLYANRVRSFLRVVFPLTMSGVVAGSVLVFIPSLGAYITPDLLGGAKSVMIGNVIYSQFMSARDYPFGSAISFVLMTVMLVGTLIYFRSGAES